MDAIKIICKYYPEDNALRRLLLHHSEQVRDKALDVCRHHPELQADTALVENGAMLHDIGIFLCNAPSIHCFGTEDYLLHGSLGATIMRKEGCEDIARICERHTGTGLRRETFIAKGITPPPYDLLPETVEEQIVCYADKFFSKSHPERERDVDQTLRSLAKFGEEGIGIFQAWVKRFNS